MKLVVALGGNALMQRNEPLRTERQWTNARIAARSLEPVAREHQLILTHGNGPQVGLLAMQADAYKDAETYSFDVMCAATGGMIGYMLEQELGNLLGYDVPIATILTRIEVDRADPEFSDPSKFVGPQFDQDKADELARTHDWVFRQDGEKWRRVVPSPRPKRILWHRPIRWLLQNNAVVICSGGGGKSSPIRSTRTQRRCARPSPFRRWKTARNPCSKASRASCQVRTPPGCRFFNRCPIAQAHCKSVKPLLQFASEEHFVSCHYA